MKFRQVKLTGFIKRKVEENLPPLEEVIRGYQGASGKRKWILYEFLSFWILKKYYPDAIVWNTYFDFFVPSKRMFVDAKSSWRLSETYFSDWVYFLYLVRNNAELYIICPDEPKRGDRRFTFIKRDKIGELKFNLIKLNIKNRNEIWGKIEYRLAQAVINLLEKFYGRDVEDYLIREYYISFLMALHSKEREEKLYKMIENNEDLDPFVKRVFILNAKKILNNIREDYEAMIQEKNKEFEKFYPKIQKNIFEI